MEEIPFDGGNTGRAVFTNWVRVRHTQRRGLNDDQILSVTLIACVFNFMKRLPTVWVVGAPDESREDVESWLAIPAKNRNGL